MEVVIARLTRLAAGKEICLPPPGNSSEFLVSCYRDEVTSRVPGTGAGGRLRNTVAERIIVRLASSDLPMEKVRKRFS